jgi:sodium/hydrogen antiporter
MIHRRRADASLRPPRTEPLFLDPILAGPLEEESLEDEREDRFGLSSEAGLNDGFAFPFVYLGLTWRPEA